MRIPGQNLRGHLGALAQRMDGPASVSTQEGMLCEATVVSRNVFLEAHSPYDLEYPRRPYLHILGYCTGIKADFPYGITELDFEANPIDVDYFYEFTNEEIAILAQKGLFDRGFQVPDVMFGNTYKLPANCNILVVEPEAGDDIPVIFAEIEQANNLETTSELSGYNFARDSFKEIEDDNLLDDFADEFASVDVQDSMFIELEDMPEEEVEEEVVDEEQIRLAEIYEGISRRVMEDHELRHQARISPDSPDIEAEEALARHMAEHKVLEPLPDIREVEVLESTEISYESSPVELVDTDELEDLPVVSADIDEDLPVVSAPSTEADITEEKPVFIHPRHHEVPADIDRKAEELAASTSDDEFEINDAI